MGTLTKTVFIMLAGAMLFVAFGEMGLIHSGELDIQAPSRATPFPIFIDHRGAAPELERPAVAFNHDRHTRALKQGQKQDCGVCHVLKETDNRLIGLEAEVFKFPKALYDESDKTAIMYSYHQACVSCHRELASEGKTAGPAIGLCGKCHVRKLEVKPVVWARKPIFNYARHDGHLKALAKIERADKLNVAGKVELIGEMPKDQNCQVCHHTYDDVTKKLLYKKDSENSCQACHKSQDEKNARSIKKAAHSACIGCHLKLSEQVKKELVVQGRQTLTDQDKKRFGPIECSGCHGEQKDLKPDEIIKIPRLVRGQKDVVDVALKDPTTARMKLVPFNHKAHEPRGQFCNTCHHHSLEKCSNCHTPTGDVEKGGGITFERAFHTSTSQQACVGCHDVSQQDTKCAGCHQKAGHVIAKSSCPVCHRGSTAGVPVDAALAPIVFDKEKVPEKVQIKILEKEFKPADFPHQKVVAKLTTISNESSLARVFHGALGEQAFCSGCHHKTDPAAAQAKKVPSCGTCHNRPFDPKELGKPGIQGAYHQQCIGCHEAMKQKPVALDCVKCHPAKEEVKTVDAALQRLGKHQ